MIVRGVGGGVKGWGKRGSDANFIIGKVCKFETNCTGDIALLFLFITATGDVTVLFWSMAVITKRWISKLKNSLGKPSFIVFKKIYIISQNASLVLEPAIFLLTGSLV